MTSVTEQEKDALDTLAAQIHYLKGAAATRGEELGALVWAAHSLECPVPAGEGKHGGVWARETLENIFELQTLVKGLKQTIGDACTLVADPADVELLRVRWSLLQPCQRVKTWAR